MHSRESYHSTVMAGNLTAASPAVQHFLSTNPVGQLAQMAYAQSAIVSFEDINLVIAWLGVACIPLIFLLRRRKQAGPIHVEIEAAG